jgi:hypothetical protein
VILRALGLTYKLYFLIPSSVLGRDPLTSLLTELVIKLVVACVVLMNHPFSKSELGYSNYELNEYTRLEEWLGFQETKK